MVYKFHKIYFSGSEVKRLIIFAKKHGAGDSVLFYGDYIQSCSDPREIISNVDIYPDFLLMFVKKRTPYGVYFDDCD